MFAVVPCAACRRDPGLALRLLLRPCTAAPKGEAEPCFTGFPETACLGLRASIVGRIVSKEIRSHEWTWRRLGVAEPNSSHHRRRDDGPFFVGIFFTARAPGRGSPPSPHRPRRPAGRRGFRALRDAMTSASPSCTSSPTLIAGFLRSPSTHHPLNQFDLVSFLNRRIRCRRFLAYGLVLCRPASAPVDRGAFCPTGPSRRNFASASW